MSFVEEPVSVERVAFGWTVPLSSAKSICKSSNFNIIIIISHARIFFLHQCLYVYVYIDTTHIF